LTQHGLNLTSGDSEEQFLSSSSGTISMKSSIHDLSSILAHQQHQEDTFIHVLLKTIEEAEFWRNIKQLLQCMWHY